MWYHAPSCFFFSKWVLLLNKACASTPFVEKSDSLEQPDDWELLRLDTDTAEETAASERPSSLLKSSFSVSSASGSRALGVENRICYLVGLSAEQSDVVNTAVMRLLVCIAFVSVRFYLYM